MAEPDRTISDDDCTEYGCSASVTITLRITGKGHWGAKATVAEVQRQGGQETLNALHHALSESRLQYEVVGKPQVGAVTWSTPK